MSLRGQVITGTMSREGTYFDTITLATVASVGMPPQVGRGFADAWITLASHERHANLGRRVTSMRNWAGTMFDRSLDQCSRTNGEQGLAVFSDDVTLSAATTGEVCCNNLFNTRQVPWQDATTSAGF